MKASLMTTAAMLLAFALPALAGPTETITGCATVADPATNFTTFADPTCYQAPHVGGDGLLLSVAVAAWGDLLTPEEEPDTSVSE
jgi:hypothetical protein